MEKNKVKIAALGTLLFATLAFGAYSWVSAYQGNGGSVMGKNQMQSYNNNQGNGGNSGNGAKCAGCGSCDADKCTQQGCGNKEGGCSSESCGKSSEGGCKMHQNN